MDNTDEHELLAAIFGPEYVLTHINESEHSETLVSRKGDETRNVEVIYHTYGDVVLLQENGSDSNQHASAFLWTCNQGWHQKAKQIIDQWLPFTINTTTR